MNMIALFWNDIYIYFHGLIIAFAILVTIIAAIAFCKFKCGGNGSMMLNVAVAAIPIGIICSRLLYCIVNYNEFKTFADFINMGDGGYSLYGAILGVILAVLLVHWYDDRNSIGLCFDCIGVAAALGISIGRMASYFSLDNLGIIMNDFGLNFFPFSVYNTVTCEWCFATFLFESIAEFIMFFCLWALLSDNYDTRLRNESKNGDIGMLFIMMHGALQSLADSMHSKALRFPFNSFVRVQQIIAVFSLAIIFVIFLVRHIMKKKRFSPAYIGYIAGFAAMVGIAAYMEFDRISDTNYWHHHAIMMICLTGCAMLCVALYKSLVKKSDLS